MTRCCCQRPPCPRACLAQTTDERQGWAQRPGRDRHGPHRAPRHQARQSLDSGRPPLSLPRPPWPSCLPVPPRDRRTRTARPQRCDAARARRRAPPPTVRGFPWPARSHPGSSRRNTPDTRGPSDSDPRPCDYRRPRSEEQANSYLKQGRARRPEGGLHFHRARRAPAQHPRGYHRGLFCAVLTCDE